MLIRVTGANSGIKEYLEKGQMKDRFFDRDQLDERKVLLDGDLNIVDDIINTIDKDGDKYFHYTLSFKEDFISEETLNSIAKEFRDYYFTAYKDEELCFYAEAHLPKIKSYQDKASGELVERKPHIHIVVPQINLLSGNTLAHNEMSNTDYRDAFQEYINCKYGLESPKDNRRTTFNSRSEVISRYKGDAFTGIGKDHKETIFDWIIDKDITTRENLISTLEQNGYQVKIRNANNPEKLYLNIKAADGDKGINLKEFVFSEEFLKLPAEGKANYLKYKDKVIGSSRDERLEFMAKENSWQSVYIEAGLSRPLPGIYMERINEWNDTIARQRKYVDRMVTKSERAKYMDMDITSKQNYLDEFEVKFYKKHGVENEPTGNELRTLGTIYQRVAANNLESTGVNLAVFASYCEELGDDRIGAVTKEWRERRGAEYARITGISKVRHIGDTIDNQGQQRTSAIDSISIDYINSQIDNSVLKEELANLMVSVKANVLLELLEKTHGIIPEKYTLTINNKGEDRIKCGNNNYSVVDFCRKEMNLNWEDSIKILRTTELMQKEIDRVQGFSVRNEKYLKGEYQSWLKEFKVQKDSELALLQKEVKDKFNAIKHNYQQKREELDKQNHPYHLKDELKRKLKMERLLENRSLHAARNKDMADIRAKYNLDMQESYRVFLTEKAGLGDDQALDELRRLRIDFTEYERTGAIRHVDRYKEFRLNITHEVDANGIITYKLNNSEIIKDIGKRVDLLTKDEEHLKLGLDLAISKYGSNLELFGSEEFRKNLVDLAIKNGYRVTFKDSFSEYYRQRRVVELKNEIHRLKQCNKNFFSDNHQSTGGLLVTKVEVVGVINEYGRYTEVGKLNVFDMNTKKEYEVSSNQITYLIKEGSVHSGDMISIDATSQNRIQIEPHFWSRYSRDLEQGVLISDFIQDNKIIVEFPEWRQAKYQQEYFTINSQGIADKLTELGYQHGDMVSIKPQINLQDKTMDYKLEIIGDGQYKAQAKKDILETDIQLARTELSANVVGENGGNPNKEISGKVISYGHGSYKGESSSYIILEDNSHKLPKEVVQFKEEFCSKHNIALHQLEKQFAGTIIDYGTAKYTEKAKEEIGFIKLNTPFGEKTVWGNDLTRVIADNNLNKGDNIYLAKIGERQFITENSEKPKTLFVYECAKIDKELSSKTAQLTRSPYTKYWNPGFKDLIDNKELTSGQTYYIASNSQTISYKEVLQRDFIIQPINNDLATEKQTAVDKILSRSDQKQLIKLVSGIILSYGVGKYSETSTPAFYVEVKDLQGKTQKLWGKDLERLVSENKLEVGEAVLLAKTGEKELNYGVKQSIYDCEKLPALQEATKEIKQQLKALDATEPTRASMGTILDFGTRTVKGEKLNFIKLVTDSGKEFTYWDKNLKVDNLEKGKSIYIAQAKEAIIRQEVRTDNFAAREVGRDINKRAVELVRKREIENARKEVSKDFSLS